MTTVILIIVGVIIWIILEVRYESRPRLEKAKEYVSNLVKEGKSLSFFSVMDNAKKKFSLTDDEVSMLSLHLRNILKKQE